ncbi:MAG TPA: protein kinase [Thermoanaerobaculia bacterium]
MIGTRLGSYEITAKLGEGGMGEVYRATDTKLKRDVAIKVLPAAFTEDRERLARFEREAQLLAQLHHPNIASIFGIEESGGARALVMELVEGPTLAEHLESGCLPLDESLSIARQIAEALEEAHEKGIIHRDLKPQNVKASIDGKVKVLDFGLAKAMDPVGGSSPSASKLAASPTLTLGATVHGVILGTAAYMSPEQARGIAADRRADVWAFGVMLWEMLTGASMFAADTVSDTLAGVLRAEIDLERLPPETPPAIRRLLRRCLERNPRNRLHSIADARIVIDEVLAGGSEAVAAPDAAVAPAAAKRALLPWAVAALAVAAAAAAWLLGRGANVAATPLFVDLGAPEGERFQFQGDFGAPAVLSRDGTQVAFGAVGADSKTRLWVRSLVTGEAKRLDATEGATAPFFAPDGKSLGYFVNAKLMIVAIAGGAPYAVADAPNGRGGAWAPDGTIVFAPDFRSGLFRLPAGGGRPAPITSVDSSRHSTHRWPALTPDARAVVYLATNHATDRTDESELRWVRLDGSDDHALVPSPANGVVAAGELLSLRQQSLVARPIDDEGKLGDATRALAPDLLYDPSTWRSAFTAVGDRLLYSPGGATQGTHISRVDRSGRPLAEIGGDDNFYDLQLSPDGTRLAVSRGLQNDLWLFDLERGTQSRFTFEPVLEYAATWSRDGRWIYYTRSSGAPSGGIAQQIVRKAANGVGKPEVVYDTASDQIGIIPLDESADGRRLLVHTGVFPFTEQADLQWLMLDGSRELVPLLTSPATERDGRISPDGRWIAYQSNESGVGQVYVVPSSLDESASLGAKWQISVDGGGFPLWSPDGHEIVYLEPSLNLSRVEVTPDGTGGLRFGTPQAMFGTTLVPDTPSFDLAPDGQSLILNHFGEAQSRPLRVIENWRSLLSPR